MFTRTMLAVCAAGLSFAAAKADDLLRIDHQVLVRSTAPSIAGQPAHIHVREVTKPAALRTAPGAARVVLFVHGRGSPGAVFDPPVEGYSWMAYLAEAGFDTFALDLTGYGASTRPAPMNDPCNLPKAAQGPFIPSVIPAACDPSYPRPITTMRSDWDDIDAVVERLRKLRGVDKIDVVAWSQGGPRAAGWVMRHPEKVSRVVMLAPGYAREDPTLPPRSPQPSGGPMHAQSGAEFVAAWNGQVGCPDQYDRKVADAIWAQTQESDPVGATWGPGVRRAPSVLTEGFNRTTVAGMTTPFLMVVGPHDNQVPAERIRELYADLGARQKVFIDLACSSHNALWEKNRDILFKASVDWLRDGKVDGVTEGVLRKGY